MDITQQILRTISKFSCPVICATNSELETVDKVIETSEHMGWRVYNFPVVAATRERYSSTLVEVVP
jgi:hypothetical protein